MNLTWSIILWSAVYLELSSEYTRRGCHLSLNFSCVSLLRLSWEQYVDPRSGSGLLMAAECEGKPDRLRFRHWDKLACLHGICTAKVIPPLRWSGKQKLCLVATISRLFTASRNSLLGVVSLLMFVWGTLTVSFSSTMMDSRAVQRNFFWMTAE